MLDTITKIEQFKKQVSKVPTDYKVITDNDIVNYILEMTNAKIVTGDWSDTCHYDTHSDNGHIDNHMDSHPDCANSILGEDANS